MHVTLHHSLQGSSVAGLQAYDSCATCGRCCRLCLMCLHFLCISIGTLPDLYDADCLRSQRPVSDVNLLQAVAVVGKKRINRWSTVAEMVGSRGQIQCRERYCNVLDPELKSGSLPCPVLH